MTRWPWLTLLLLGAVAWAQGGKPSPFLHGLPLEGELPAGVPLEKAGLRAFPRGGATVLPEVAARSGARPDDAGVLLLPSLAGLVAQDAPLPRHRQPSWVIDYDEKAFAPVWAALAADAGSTPSIDALVGFAERYVQTKSLRRAFDLASQVAKSRAGDCTEHAVFLAALLRRHGFPARVMLGVAMARIDGVLGAYGHAWVEVHDGQRWRVADAALPASIGAVYLPAGEMTDEGPSYALGLMQTVARLGFERLVLLPPR